MASNTQTNLFDTYEGVQITTSTDMVKSFTLKSKPGDDPGLAKVKNDFNYRLKAIAKLKDEIEKLPKVFALLNEKFNITAKPTEELFVKSRRELIETMEVAFNRKSFSKNEREHIRFLMLEELNSISEMGYEYDEKYREYFDMDTPGGVSPEAEEIFQEIVNNMMGMDVDIQDVIGEERLSPEGFEEKYGAELREKAKELEEREKNQKQQRKQMHTGKEEEGGPDLNSHFIKIYKNIAKKIHPDLEQNATIRKEKQKLMQELAHAKDNRDLFQLISIKLKVEKIENKEMVLDEVYLKLYADRLLEQKKDLEADISVLKKQSGKNSWLHQNFHAPHPKTTLKRLEAYRDDLLIGIDQCKELNNSLKTVKGIKKYLRAERDDIDDRMFYDIFGTYY